MRFVFVSLLPAPVLAAARGPSIADIAAGLREAPEAGTERAAAGLGVRDGDNAEPRLNRTAEAAAPTTKALIRNAIFSISQENARVIHNGPKNAAVRENPAKQTAESRARAFGGA